MGPDQQIAGIQILKQLGKLEDANAEALADDADPRTLTSVWERIKALRKEMAGKEDRLRYEFDL